MEQLISEIEAYAAANGLSPKSVLRQAIAAGGTQWGKWKSGAQSPTMHTVDRLRRWMAENPPKGTPEEDAA